MGNIPVKAIDHSLEKSSTMGTTAGALLDFRLAYGALRFRFSAWNKPYAS